MKVAGELEEIEVIELPLGCLEAATDGRNLSPDVDEGFGLPTPGDLGGFQVGHQLLELVAEEKVDALGEMPGGAPRASSLRTSGWAGRARA